MMRDSIPDLPLPKGWPRRIKSALLHVFSLAHYALIGARGWAADGLNPHARHAAEIDRLEEEGTLLREEIRIKDARMEHIPPHRRPHYPPPERLAILELKAARGWSLAQTARTFLLEPATVASWIKRVDDQGKDTLVQVPHPVNTFPDFVRHLVRRLKALCPSLGKVKIAQVLARAGLHLGASTVRRMIRERSPVPPAPGEAEAKPGRIVTGRYSDHVYHVDLTAVPTTMGLWASWFPFCLPQVWPFAWWVGVVVDHFSRRCMGAAVYRTPPSSLQIRAFLGRLFRKAKPRYLVCDKGGQFWCDGFKGWCRKKGVRPRFGAVGRYGSIAVVERFIRTFKEGLRRIVVPLRREALRREVDLHVGWYNEHRPHEFLMGRTPDEVYFLRDPANEGPRIEPRARWPAGSPCARPMGVFLGSPGDGVEMEVLFLGGRRRLPVVRLKRVA
jgi:transposase InsO family protein